MYVNSEDYGIFILMKEDLKLYYNNIFTDAVAIVQTGKNSKRSAAKR